MVGRQRANRLQRRSSDTDNRSHLISDGNEGTFSHLAREPYPVCVLRGRRNAIAGKQLFVRSYALYSVQVHLSHALRTPYARAFPIPCTILQVNCQWGICSVLLSVSFREVQGRSGSRKWSPAMSFSPPRLESSGVWDYCMRRLIGKVWT